MKSGIGFRRNEIYLAVIFFGNDGLLLAESKTEIERLIRMVEKISGETGLRINTGKSEVATDI